MKKILNGVEVDIPAEEIAGWRPQALPTDAERQEQLVEAIRDQFDALNGTDRVLLKIAFILYNDIRVLKGQQPITKAQFRSWVADQITGE